MPYYIKGLEYLGKNVKKPAEAKRVVTLGKSDSLPSRDEVLKKAAFMKRVKKVWVMRLEGNKWSKALDTINL
ncbi:MAG: hypothetical protein ACE5HH_02625 [Candidatus Hydrothermarchaeales archaeon]